MKTTTRLLAAVASAALLATACSDAPDTTEDPETPTTPAEEPTDDETSPPDDDETTDGTDAADYTACQITDEGGVDDRSFNQTANAGMVRAEDDLGVGGVVLESTSATDYAPNMTAALERDCDMIIPIGFNLGETTQTAAEANPDQLFTIVDFDLVTEDFEDVSLDNVRELTYATDQAAFLAGYVAAAMTDSGIVGTYGGGNFPTVTIFMDGYLAGVRYYNQEIGTDVQVLGWDGENGEFTENFTDQSRGRDVTESLLQNGADIIMPVAGPVGLGTAAAIDAAGTGAMIWVDTDGFETQQEQFRSLILTSVEKRMDDNVFDAIASDIEGAFEPGLYVGTLENEGVGISPFHEFEDDVPQEVKDALDTIRAGIIDGSISVDPADYS